MLASPKMQWPGAREVAGRTIWALCVVAFFLAFVRGLDLACQQLPAAASAARASWKWAMGLLAAALGRGGAAPPTLAG